MIPELQKQILDANVGRTINQTWNKVSDWVHGLPFYNRKPLGSKVTEAIVNIPEVKKYIEHQQYVQQEVQKDYDEREASGHPVNLAVNRFTDLNTHLGNTLYGVLGAPVTLISKALNVDQNLAATALMIATRGRKSNLDAKPTLISKTRTGTRPSGSTSLAEMARTNPDVKARLIQQRLRAKSTYGDLSGKPQLGLTGKKTSSGLTIKPSAPTLKPVSAELLQANVTPQSFKDITADKELVAWAIDQGFIPADTLPTRKQLALAARYQKQIENMNRAYLRSDKDMFYEKSALAPWNISVYGKKFQNLPPPLQRRILALKAASGEKIHLHHKWQKMKDAESRIYLKKLVERGEASMEDLRLFDFLLDKSGRSAGGIYGANPKRQSLVPLTESSHVGLHGKYKDQGLEAKRNQSTEFKKSLKGKTATQVIEGAIKDRDEATPALNEVMHEMHELEIRGQKLQQWNQ